MKPAILPLLAGLAATPVAAEVYHLTCQAPGDATEHRIVLDTDQRAALQDGRAGNIATISDEAIYYFLRYRARVQFNRYNMGQATLDMAISRPAPATGYDRIKLDCRRNPGS